MTAREMARSPALWLVAAGLLAACAAAVVIGAPAAALVLAALCIGLAVVRVADRRRPPAFMARSTAVDVVLLVAAAVALLVLAPAGNLT
ncbi:hypothetical protein [Georgenia sp. MJ170]|uniref:hypothetical protein n=1 Tax=Georgenia sunbinii TaxID=3117728 RepID=UPI002F2652EC